LKLYALEESLSLGVGGKISFEMYCNQAKFTPLKYKSAFNQQTVVLAGFPWSYK